MINQVFKNFTIRIYSILKTLELNQKIQFATIKKGVHKGNKPLKIVIALQIAKERVNKKIIARINPDIRLQILTLIQTQVLRVKVVTRVAQEIVLNQELIV